ncbi:sigma 54-interacting transcriptional regulator [Brevibacillus choshinensis]|uniref:sigma 54-interacting transcriptional regulator n=1 Tax=Brevibacillus choshinensis TaxID=54911 RepID=UPI002E1ACC50|nr:sigma 54-interacting transcriptional regulator [Brevibacillus choshinensis]MED4749801.1 sigma 54-interacting transcriptional regulator [Brevibacillus choshinensis]
MLVKKYMTTNFATLTSTSTFREAVTFFQRGKIGIIPVVNGDEKLLGVITRYSLFRALLDNVPLDSVVTPYIIHDPLTLYEDEDMQRARELSIRNQSVHIIVLSRDNRVCGIMGQAEIVRRYEVKTQSLVDSLEFLIATMPTGVIALDRTGVILVMNKAAATMCNQEDTRLIGSPLSDVLPDLEQVLSSQGFVAEDSPLHRITIGDKKLIVTAKKISHDHQPWGALLILQDFTDYEAIANELESTKRLEKTLQTVVENAYDGLILIDELGKVQMVNDAVCELVNHPRNEIIGHDVDTYFPELKLTEALEEDFQGENIEAVFMGKRRSLVTKIPIMREKQTVGAIGKIIYRNLNKWKSVTNRLETLEKEVSYYRAELSLLGGKTFDLDDILTRNDEMDHMIRLARQSAPGFSSILLLGESGTGKELFARGIHAASNRSGNFIKINCAATPFELWESEFFGYADGAFTGAKRGGKPGKFELAHNGTLFLDEIGDMPLSMQVKLLRVLQEREFERVGGTETIRVNVRIVAATNKNLEQMVANDEFREDLYYRLNVIPIHIPPLRQRIEDIPLLTTAITKKFSHLMGLGPITVNKNAMMLLASHHWPGNVRELENVIERAMNCLNSNVLDVVHLPDYLAYPATAKAKSSGGSSASMLPSPKPIDASSSDHYKRMVLDAEKQAVEAALKAAGENRTVAAKMLGISRSQLYKKLSKFQMNQDF